MKKTLYTVKHLGCKATRTSHRAYTHVIFGSYAKSDESIEREAAREEKINADWVYPRAVETVRVGIGGYISDSRYPRDAEDVKRAVELLAMFPTKDAYLQHLISKHTALKREYRNRNQNCVVQWSMSERAAVKALGTWQKRGWVVRVEKTDQSL